MSENLVIVESPAKAKTIKKYLGKGFDVLASYGHVRDLLPKNGAVDPDHNFAMQYVSIERNEKHVAKIAKALSKAKNLYLAPDPDREGEAIAWHLVELLKERKILKNKKIFRVSFHQITKNAITEAIQHPREISMHLVDAQQARRALDFLVGFNLSPLLWRKIQRGLSAGRVQSPALRLIVERELEIEKFKKQEYWTIHAQANAKKQSFGTKLIEYKGKKLQQFDIIIEKESNKIVKELTKAADGKFIVSKVTKKERKRQPYAPFTTSTLQQEASKKLSFSTQKTMIIAQQLYEGIDLDEGSVGLITYMRTDSVTLAQEAIFEMRDYIKKEFGDKNLPENSRLYKTKSKNAQEAHEAIRPTSVFRHYNKIKKYLSPDQYKLYQLIWKRTIASQMADALLNTVSINLLAGESGIFRASGSTITFPGFLAVYEETTEGKKDDSIGTILPDLKENDSVKVKEIYGTQHFTEPPPRYSEANLVKALEEYGIGRPSTYASIITTLKKRHYAEMQNRRFIPTDVGKIVNRFLTKYFTQYVDYDFTAELENHLDEIARGERKWVPTLKEFWEPFIKQIKDTGENVTRGEATQEKMKEKCPECGKPLVIRLSKSGQRFIGCTTYPDCTYTRSVEGDQAEELKEIKGRKCPKCNADLVLRHGRYGKFIGCSSYPDCDFIEKLNKPEETGVTCPQCKTGQLLKRHSKRKNKIFYACSEYPKCQYAIWYLPIDKKCPKCKWPILMLKITKKEGTQEVCPQKECNYAKKSRKKE